MITLWRIMQAGLRNFMRNAWLSTAATIVMTITLTIVVVSYISNAAITSTVEGVTDKIDISVYLKNGITPQEVEQFTSSLKQSQYVSQVTYISADAAQQAFREANVGNKETLKGLEITGNVLPPSLQVKARDQSELDEVLAVILEPQNRALQDPSTQPSYSGDRRDTINSIVSFSNFFMLAGLIASGIFIAISILIIFNTIRMAIFTRRDEIEIMKLVGATKWFIRGPFIFEAMLYGVIGAAIAVTLSYVLLIFGGPKLGSYIDLAAIIAFFKTQPFVVIGIEMLIGIAIGGFSSILALSRYLKL